jgi:MOSC domain-containing protein YiiM
MSGKIISVSRSATHSFSKERLEEIVIVAGLGVEGDAHAGVTVRHRYLVKKDPTAPNLCQVHLLQAELFRELSQGGIEIDAGEMGENVTTAGVDLLGLPLGTRLHLGASAVVEVTGLRTPCTQMNGLRPGLMKACFGRDAQGGLVRKAGIMGVAAVGGVVRVGDAVEVELPDGPFVKLGPV